MSKGNPTPNQLLRLNYLNNFLIQKQNEILDKQKFYLTLMDGLLVDKKLTTDFELELVVSYHIDSSHLPDEYGDGLLWEDRTQSLKGELEMWFDKSPKEGDELELEQPCCYLLHRLLYHSRLGLKWVSKIKQVWVDIHLIDQINDDIDLKTGEVKSRIPVIIYNLGETDF